MQIQSLSQEDPLEEDMETYSSILAWIIPQIEEPGRLWKELDTSEATQHILTKFVNKQISYNLLLTH